VIDLLLSSGPVYVLGLLIERIRKRLRDVDLRERRQSEQQKGKAT
jgi:hypothetical protein